MASTRVEVTVELRPLVAYAVRAVLAAARPLALRTHRGRLAVAADSLDVALDLIARGGSRSEVTAVVTLAHDQLRRVLEA